MTVNREQEHDFVYGQPFSQFKKAELEATVDNFDIRFRANSIDAGSLIQGQNCLDAGCGGGRGSIYMMRNGARSLEYVDISPTNVDTTTRRLQELDFENINGTVANIETLPFEDGVFDFLWCYGVVHHAADTDACLKEISRVLKVGGTAFIFIYGSGGIFWYSMRQLRRILTTFTSKQCLNAMKAEGFSAVEMSNFLDSWKTPYLRCYTQADASARLKELGYEGTRPWPFGTGYDLNHRKNTYPEDAVWMGEGDLRYLLTKTGLPRGECHRLPSGELGSDLPFHPFIVDPFDPLFERLGRVVAGDPHRAVAACGYVHRALYALLREDRAFDSAAYENVIRSVVSRFDRIGDPNVE